MIADEPSRMYLPRILPRIMERRIRALDLGRLSTMAAGWVPALLFGLRLWASVCLALYIAFWLELDSPFWAGASAAIVCQPQLGAALRKGWFRMIGTLVGAVAIVVLTACFPQDRASFLLGLALWGAACAFVATLIRNFAGYGAALAGYTAAIVASDQLGAIGGAHGDVFMLAVTRASETCIGIVCAGIVLAGTDLGGARRRLATLFADLAARIAAGLTNTFAATGPEPSDTRSMRRALIQRVIALDPMIDQTLGESAQIRYRSPDLERAVDGLFAALAGWRTVANHLVQLPSAKSRQEAGIILQILPRELRSINGEPSRWIANPASLRLLCETTAHRLIELPSGTPSLRLLADQTAAALAGMSHALNGLALLVADPARPPPRRRDVSRLYVADWLPGLVNAARAFVTICAVALLWIVTAWPSGAEAITFAAISVILFAPRADQAHAVAMSFMVGTGIAAVVAAIIRFAVLPHLETFAAFSLAIGLWLVPAGAAAGKWKSSALTYMAAYFVPLLAPENQMSYDTVQFYNATLAILAGIGAVVMSFRLLPPLSPAFRTRRLLVLTLRDLRRLAMGRTPGDWTGHVHGRLAAMPREATPLQRAQLLGSLSVGSEIIRLRPLALRLGVGAEFEHALAALAQGKSSTAIARLTRLDAALAGNECAKREVVRARACILALSEVLLEHADHFDAGAH
ncbi:FUSC family protein [Bradyrhizobium sp. USDA 10063]